MHVFRWNRPFQRILVDRSATISASEPAAHIITHFISGSTHLSSKLAGSGSIVIARHGLERPAVSSTVSARRVG